MGIRCESVTVTLLCGGRKPRVSLERNLWEGGRVGGNRVRISAVMTDDVYPFGRKGYLYLGYVSIGKQDSFAV